MDLVIGLTHSGGVFQGSPKERYHIIVGHKRVLIKGSYISLMPIGAIRRIWSLSSMLLWRQL